MVAGNTDYIMGYIPKNYFIGGTFMKCIEKAKNYWKENKDEIILTVKIGVAVYSTYLIGVFVGVVCDELKWNAKLKDKFVTDACLGRAEAKAFGDYDKPVRLLGMNRDKCPEFDRMFSQAADTGYITDVKGEKRKVVGAIIYGADEVTE